MLTFSRGGMGVRRYPPRSEVLMAWAWESGVMDCLGTDAGLDCLLEEVCDGVGEDPAGRVVPEVVRDWWEVGQVSSGGFVT